MAYRQDLFTATVNQLRGGRTQEELSAKLNELVRQCRDVGKSGELTLTIKVKPDKGDTGQYFLEDDIKQKLPQFARGQTLMFGTPEGNLQRTDPAQGELQLRSVQEPIQPPKSAFEDSTPAKTVAD